LEQITGGRSSSKMEIGADLESAGFVEVACLRRDAWMSLLVVAGKAGDGPCG
jgi:hypothetical protein